MKHIILNKQNDIVAIGEKYTLEIDEYATRVFKKETSLHKLDNSMFDIGFLHKTAEGVPLQVLENPSTYKYIDGDFVKIEVN